MIILTIKILFKITYKKEFSEFYLKSQKLFTLRLFFINVAYIVKDLRLLFLKQINDIM